MVLVWTEVVHPLICRIPISNGARPSKGTLLATKSAFIFQIADLRILSYVAADHWQITEWSIELQSAMHIFILVKLLTLWFHWKIFKADLSNNGIWLDGYTVHNITTQLKHLFDKMWGMQYLKNTILTLHLAIDDLGRRLQTATDTVRHKVANLNNNLSLSTPMNQLKSHAYQNTASLKG